MLGINPEKVRYIIAEARMFDGKEGDSDPDSGSNGTDDGMADVLEDQPDDATPQVLAEFIRDLDEDEQIELVALAWVGRGTFSIEDWEDAVAEARRAHNKRTAEYLFSLPMLGDYLEEGLSLVEDEDENEIEDEERD
jgi:Protein of unknown function (DUF3775)